MRRILQLAALIFATLMLMLVLNCIYQTTCLYRAVESNNISFAEDAIEHGALVNWRRYPQGPSFWGEFIYTNPTPLIVACQNGNVELVRLLLEHGADVNKKDNYTDNTPLLSALQSPNSNRFKLALYLIENGADIHALQEGVDSAFYRCLVVYPTDNETCRIELLTYLLEHDIEQTVFMTRQSALTFAAQCKNDAAVICLIEKGGWDVNSVDFSGDTALIVAVKTGNYLLAKSLLELGADKNVRDTLGNSALDYAHQMKQATLIDLLS